MKTVVVRTPSRLHLSLIDLNGSRNRIDGSIGLAIRKPYFEFLVQPSENIEIVAITTVIFCSERIRQRCAYFIASKKREPLL